MASKPRLLVHINGVLVHGRGSFVYLSTPAVSGDSNLAVECFMRTLQQLPLPLPPVSYLQADNASGDCKNKFVFAFFVLLVEAKVFKKV